MENPVQPILNAGQCLAFIEVAITNEANFMKYVIGHLPSITQYGGKIIFEGYDNTSYEGEKATYNFMVVQQWNSKAEFDSWWNSPAYKPWKDMRATGASVTLKLISQRGD